MPSKRVLVLFESGRGGAAALDLARELAEAENATITVVSVVPTAPSGSRCGNSALEYNLIVREAVEKDLNEARERLAVLGQRAAYELLMEGVDPPLAQFTAAGGFDLVLLPARRRPLRSGKHPEASALRSVAGAEVRIVDPRSQQRAHARGSAAALLTAFPGRGGGGDRGALAPLPDPDRGADRGPQEDRTEVPRAYEEHHRDGQHGQPDGRPPVTPVASHQDIMP
jgi:nucleotide-binding universal stress UspA family protein